MAASSVCIRFITDGDTNINEFGIRLYYTQYNGQKEDGLSSSTVFLNWFCFGMQILHPATNYKRKQKCT